jgi:hypothetical protein
MEKYFRNLSFNFKLKNILFISNFILTILTKYSKKTQKSNPGISLSVIRYLKRVFPNPWSENLLHTVKLS